MSLCKRAHLPVSNSGTLDLWNADLLQHTHTQDAQQARKVQPAHKPSQRTNPASAQCQPARNPSQRATPAGAQTQPARNSSQRIASASAQTQPAHKPSWRNMSEFQFKATHISLAHLDRLNSALNLEEDWSKQLQLAEERNDT